MSILVIAQHDHTALLPATLSTLHAASELGKEITLLVAGNQCQKVAEMAASQPLVTKVLLAEHRAYEHFLAENIADLVVDIAEEYDYILAPANTFGKNILPRIAALLDVSAVTDVIAILDKNHFKRPIYAGNAIATIHCEETITLLTIRTAAFPALKENTTTQKAPVETLSQTYETPKTTFVTKEHTQSQGPDLTTARAVISGGRGLGSKENFALLENIAKKIDHCAVGASRAAVDAHFVPNEYQVGQTGKIVAPELYIAVGISGAIQHLSGMKDSKIIVAINKDENAPIFDIADYGLVADLFDVLPKLEKLL